MAVFHTKKRLGQNFLKSEDIIQKIVALINPQPADKIIEIGPGRGILTKALASSGADIISVEYDRDLIGYLKRAFQQQSNVEVLNQDFLSFEPDFAGYKLVGNLPFNITSPVIEWTVRHHHGIICAYFMVQKEVAARIASSPGSKDWSPIAIFTQLYFNIKICFDVHPKHFQPSPKVTSSIIELIPKKVKTVRYYTQFEKLVRASFQRRRKILYNNLVPDLIPDTESAREIFAGLGFPEDSRAEQLTTEQFLKLTNLLVKRNIMKV